SAGTDRMAPMGGAGKRRARHAIGEEMLSRMPLLASPRATGAAAPIGGGLGRRQALHAPQELLFRDHVDHRIRRLIVAAEDRPTIDGKARRRTRFGFVDLDGLLDRV